VRVLFLALGASRKQAAADESGQVVADGGRAVVLIDARKPWSRTEFDPAVEVVELSRIEATRLPVRLEQLALYRMPRALFRTAGRGRLRPTMKKAAGRYEARIADRVHRKLVATRFRPGWGKGAHRLLRRAVPGPYELIVVLDPISMPYAAGLVADLEARGVTVPPVAFGLDYAREYADAR
jgi:hypothetical protein